MRRKFTWRDAGRTIHFGAGCAHDSLTIVGTDYTLLTTERALATLPAVGHRAGAVIQVPPGQIDELAAAIVPRVQPRTSIVAFGGGRVIDTAKAVAAVGRGVVAAIPTTLSAAEMTGAHRQARGASPETPFVRPQVVLCDPTLSASAPAAELAASSLNALAHAIEAQFTTLTNPATELLGTEAADLIAGAWSTEQLSLQAREDLALGALLSGYAIDSSGFGLHHVASQTLAREAGVRHAMTNAVMLEHTLRALADRQPRSMQRICDAIAADPIATAVNIRFRAGSPRLRDFGLTDGELERCAKAAALRPQLQMTPPAADHDELLTLYEAAF